MSDAYIRNDQVQAALVSHLKGKSIITDELVTDNQSDGTKEIREDQWRGTKFTYPNVRVKMISNEPISGKGCHQRVEVSFLVFSENPSSLEADTIAGIMSDELHEKGFSANNLAISLRTRNLVPAIWSGITTWRSEVIMSGIVSG